MYFDHYGLCNSNSGILDCQSQIRQSETLIRHQIGHLNLWALYTFVGDYQNV